MGVSDMAKESRYEAIGSLSRQLRSIPIRSYIRDPSEKPTTLGFLYKINSPDGTGIGDVVPMEGMHFSGMNFFSGDRTSEACIYGIDIDHDIEKKVILFSEAAADRNVEVYLIDPHEQRNDGTCIGWKYEEFAWRASRIPEGLVLYDRDRRKRTEHSKRVYGKEMKSINPLELRQVTSDKWLFSELISVAGLQSYHPATDLFTSDNLEKYLDLYRSIIIKPRTGMNMRGTIGVELKSEGYGIKYTGDRPGESRRELFTDRDKLLSRLHVLTESDEHILQNCMPLYGMSLSNKNETSEFSPEVRFFLQRGENGYLQSPYSITKLVELNFSGKKYYMDTMKILNTIYGCQATDIYDELKYLALRVWSILESEIEQPIGDVSVDIGLLQDGGYSIIEANSITGPPRIQSELKLKDKYNNNILRYASYLGRT